MARISGKGVYFFCGSFVFLCLVFLMLSRLFIAALWSPVGKGLTSWLLLVIVTFPCGILGQVWYLIVSFPDHCHLSYFECIKVWGFALLILSNFFLNIPWKWNNLVSLRPNYFFFMRYSKMGAWTLNPSRSATENVDIGHDLYSMQCSKECVKRQSLHKLWDKHSYFSKH